MIIIYKINYFSVMNIGRYDLQDYSTFHIKSIDLNYIAGKGQHYVGSDRA